MTDLSIPERAAQGSAELDISGMTCASCAMRVEKALAKVPGVAGVSVNLATEKATVSLSDAATGVDALIAAVTKSGYQATPVVEEVAQSLARNPSAFVSLARLKTKDDYTYMHSVAVCGLMVGMERVRGDIYKVLFHLPRGVTCNGINRMGRLLRLEQALRSVQ